MEEMDEKTKLNEERWNQWAERYDRCFSLTRWTQKKLVSLLELGENPCLLDLACGTGWAVRYAAMLADGRGEFHGIDISSKMIEKAEARSVRCRNVHFRESNVEQLPFSNAFFDFIICSNAFHHFSNPENALREVCRVLKLGGTIYILDVTADDFVTKMLDRLAPELEPAHVKIYSTREYQTLLRRAGLHYVASKRVVFSVKVHIAEK
jgi:ubiquinone/menaquinone biosynthesis C-methylase UbiE